MKSFKVYRNGLLKKEVDAYHNMFYVGYKKEGNPDFLNHLKNMYFYESREVLLKSKKEVVDRLLTDLPEIIKKEELKNVLVLCVPRSKADMHENQLYFYKSVEEACKELGIQCGVELIKRVKHTATTHLSKFKNENLPMPYPGITKDTCIINTEVIKGRDVILIDDIYTKYCNIDEDCLQAVLDCEVRNLIFYAIAYTKRGV
ncbi:MAG: phosphoribosyltransferase [Clostridia bacterium]|nr:phosphoribosyltransferase [Clostridia bacterium]